MRKSERRTERRCPGSWSLPPRPQQDEGTMQLKGEPTFSRFPRARRCGCHGHRCRSERRSSSGIPRSHSLDPTVRPACEIPLFAFLPAEAWSFADLSPVATPASHRTPERPRSRRAPLTKTDIRIRKSACERASEFGTWDTASPILQASTIPPF